MKVLITNLEDYCREVQFFRKNQWKVVSPLSTIEFSVDDNDSLCINYYKSLSGHKFKVEFIKEKSSELCSTGRELVISELSDDQIKTILSNLGISTKVRLRWKLEDMVKDNLPEGKSLSDYL